MPILSISGSSVEGSPVRTLIIHVYWALALWKLFPMTDKKI